MVWCQLQKWNHGRSDSYLNLLKIVSLFFKSKFLNVSLNPFKAMNTEKELKTSMFYSVRCSFETEFYHKFINMYKEFHDFHVTNYYKSTLIKVEKWKWKLGIILSLCITK